MSGTLVVTFFENYAAGTKTEQLVALYDLARRIETTTAAAKDRLPWLKLARFGDRRTDKNSLRWDGNMLAISGVEADYDAERISFDEAVEKLGAAGIHCIVYTSPSHMEDSPRWRVLCIVSQEYPPDRRNAFLARLNGLLGGVFSSESWTLSQSYYFGSVNRNPSHRVALLDGVPIDQMVELDAIAIGKPEKAAPNGANGERGPATPPEAITDQRISGKVQSLLGNVRRAADGSKRRLLIDNGIALGGYLHLTTWSDADAVEELIQALPGTVEDWRAARRDAAWAIGQGKLKPLTLEDRPFGGWRVSMNDPHPDYETAGQETGQETAPNGAPHPKGNGHDALQAAIDHLAAPPELDYDRIDKTTLTAKAKELGLKNAAALDRAVARARKAAKERTEAEAKAHDRAARERERADKRAAAEEEKNAKLPPPLTKAEIDAELEKLADLDPADYYRTDVRNAAKKRLGFAKVGTLDARVEQIRRQRLLDNPPPPKVPTPDTPEVTALLAEFNEKYVVVDESGKGIIYAPKHDPDQNRRYYERIEFADLDKLYLNRIVLTGHDERTGEPVYERVAKVWLHHPKRGQYIDGIVFDPSGRQHTPGTLNLWRGFAVTSAPGSWDKLASHIETVICNKNQVHFDYLMDWMADMMQHPGKQRQRHPGKSVEVCARPTRLRHLQLATPDRPVQRSSAGLRVLVCRRSALRRQPGPCADPEIDHHRAVSDDRGQIPSHRHVSEPAAHHAGHQRTLGRRRQPGKPPLLRAQRQ